MGKFVPRQQPGLSGSSMRLEELAATGDPLARLDGVVGREVFGPVLDGIPRGEAKGPGGRPACEPMLPFKVLVIRSLYNPGDARIELQVTGRPSFKRFPGFSAADKAPDGKSVRAFRGKLARPGLVGGSSRPSTRGWGARGFSRARAGWWTRPSWGWRGSATRAGRTPPSGRAGGRKDGTGSRKCCGGRTWRPGGPGRTRWATTAAGTM